MKILTMSFDDGTIQDKKLVAMLEKYHMRATFHLNSGLFGQRHTIIHDGILCDHTELTAEEAKALYQEQEVAAHTVHHPDLRRLEESEILFEVHEDQKRLEEIFQRKIIGMAYPGGGKSYDDRVIAAIRSHTNIQFARTILVTGQFTLPKSWMEWHPTCGIQDAGLEELTKKFLEEKNTEEMQLFYVWGHAFEFDKFQNWNRMERFLEMISSDSAIKVMTAGETYQYAAKQK